MALEKCKECGNKVSTKAKNCPNCGAAVKKGIGCFGSIGFALIFFFFFFVIIGTMTDDKVDTATNREQTQAPKKGTVARVEYEVKKILGTSNRELKRVSSIQASGTNITIHFSVNDNLTNDMVKGAAMIDIKDILKAVQDSGYPYSNVIAVGTFSLVDKLGNSREDKVLEVRYNKSTVDRINWDGLLTKNIYSIADNVWRHPAFRKKE